jgi:hypothetical protein
MKPITKEQYQFIENNFVCSKEYNLDFESINQMLSNEKKIKKIGFVIDNFIFINNALSLFCGLFFMIVVFNIILQTL